MQKDNVTPIKSKELTLERVKEALNNWRSSKKRANEGIPVALWQQIFELGPWGATEQPTDLSN